MKNNILLLSAFFSLILLYYNTYAQKSRTKEDTKGLLWEISGNNLKQSSYLFGTFHLLNQDYLDSLKGWQEKFNQCKAIVGEIIIDSSKLQLLYASMMMKDNTLDRLLSSEEYDKTAAFLKDVSGLDLIMFNTFKPGALSTFLTIMVWAKANPSSYNPQRAGMDIYLQTLGKQQKKELKALETMEQQTALLFDNISLERQAQMLAAMVKNKDKTIAGLEKMDKCYRIQDLACLQQSMYSREWDYSEEDMNKLIFDRNKAWLPQLVSIIEKDPAFIAVGAGHLPGKEGVINLLREKGYKVKEVELK